MLSRLSHLVAKKSSAIPEVRSVSTVLWSGKLTFSSPESDFCCSSVRTNVNSNSPTWTRNLSFSSPESDFSTRAGSSTHDEGAESEWSGTLSFASPESDFVAHPDSPDWEWSGQLSFASPEADFVSSCLSVPADGAVYNNELLHRVSKSPIMNLEILHPESASGVMRAHHFMDVHQIVQLYQQLSVAHQHLPLPSNLKDALAVDESRAIVVTEASAPFHILDVNDAWVGLCGFSKQEARNQSLQLIQGPETDREALGSLVEELLNGREASAVVTNYTKNGRKFLNKLRAGPIRDARDRITHFVGILEEINDKTERVEMAM